MPLTIIRSDITALSVDAVVNAANTELRAGGGVCGAIFKAAGVIELTQACKKIGFCRTGEGLITNYQLSDYFAQETSTYATSLESMIPSRFKSYLA